MINRGHRILCIDLGTSTLKVCLFSRSKEVLYFKTYKHKGSGLYPKNLDFLHDCGPDIQNISVISLSAQAPSVVPILEDGQAGTPIFHYEHEKKVKRNDCISVFLPQVAYHKKHFPYEYKRTKVYLTLGDYLIYLFTGNFHTSLPHKDYHRVVWDYEQIKLYELNPSQFPDPVIWPHCTSKTQKNLDIPQGIQVLACNYDFLAASFGLGACSQNIAVDRAGSSIGLNFFVHQEHLKFVKEHLPCPHLNWSIYPHVYPNTFNTGIVFQDFYLFLSEIADACPESYQFQNGLETLFAQILTPISITDILEPPQIPYQSFLQLWKEFDYINFPKLRAQKVFTEYTRFLYHCLSQWPLGPIVEVRASGEPNLNYTFVNFKSRMTKIPWKLESMVHAELLGNFYATQQILSY